MTPHVGNTSLSSKINEEIAIIHGKKQHTIRANQDSNTNLTSGVFSPLQMKDIGLKDAKMLKFQSLRDY